MNVRRSKKVFLTMLLAMIAVFAMLGAAWAAISVSSGTLNPKGNNGVVASGGTATPSTSLYYYTGMTPNYEVHLTFAGTAGDAQNGETITFSTVTAGWSFTSDTINVTAADGSFSGEVILERTSGAITDVTIEGDGDNGFDHTWTLTVNPVAVNPATITISDVALYTKTDYSSGVPVTVTLPSPSGKKVALTGLELYKGTDNSVPGNKIADGGNVWGTEVTASYATDKTGVSFKTAAAGATTEQASQAFSLYATGALTIVDDNNAVVAGVPVAPTKIAGFNASVKNKTLTLSKSSESFTVNVDASATAAITAAVAGPDLKALMIAKSDGTDPTTSKSMGNGLTLTASVVAGTTPPTGKIAFSGTPKSADKVTFKVIGYSDAAATTMIASADLTITVTAATTYSMSLDPDSFTRVVSADSGTQTGKVILKQSGTVATPSLTDLVISADNVSGASGSGSGTVSWNGLTIKASTTSPATGSVGTVTITGKPNVIDSGKTFYLLAKTGSGTISNTSFSIKVTSGALTVSPATPTYYVGTPVSSGTALTVTSSPQVSSLTIKKDGESGSGGSSSTWNELTFSVTSTSKVSVAGTPKTTGTQKFILTGTSGSGTVETSFTVTVSPSGGTVTFDPNPVILDESYNQLTTMTVGELMTILFGTNVDLTGTNVDVYVTKPDGSPAVKLWELSTKTGYNGYVVNAKDVTVYYTPTMNGQHKFTFRFTYAGQVHEVDMYLNAGGYHSSGSSGCNAAGLGMMGLLAAGGLLVLRGRKG